MIRPVGTILILICSQACVAKQYVRTLPSEKEKVSKMVYAWLGGLNDKEGYFPLINCGRCENQAKVSQLFHEIVKADYRRRFVTNFDPGYYLIFLTARDKMVCVLDCDEDCFKFTEARKTFWRYAVGLTIPPQGKSKKDWGTLPDFDRRVLRMVETRDSGQFSH